ncbi:MAG: aromatic compound catabolic protein, partial [Comamonadaceae bacterium]
MTATERIEDWIAREQEVAARMEAGPGPGVPGREQTEGLSGLE